jgi:hypothetical protein
VGCDLRSLRARLAALDQVLRLGRSGSRGGLPIDATANIRATGQAWPTIALAILRKVAENPSTVL